MQYVLFAAIAILFCYGPVLACDDHVGKCKLEAWRANSPGMGMVMIEGSATCDRGRAMIRLYDGDKFLGVATGLVRGHALQAAATDISAYQTLVIKYSITPSRRRP